jgi:hypothetical protein
MGDRDMGTKIFLSTLTAFGFLRMCVYVCFFHANGVHNCDGKKLRT